MYCTVHPSPCQCECRCLPAPKKQQFRHQLQSRKHSHVQYSFVYRLNQLARWSTKCSSYLSFEPNGTFISHSTRLILLYSYHLFGTSWMWNNLLCYTSKDTWILLYSYFSCSEEPWCSKCYIALRGKATLRMILWTSLKHKRPQSHKWQYIDVIYMFESNSFWLRIPNC